MAEAEGHGDGWNPELDGASAYDPAADAPFEQPAPPPGGPGQPAPPPGAPAEQPAPPPGAPAEQPPPAAAAPAAQLPPQMPPQMQAPGWAPPPFPGMLAPPQPGGLVPGMPFGAGAVPLGADMLQPGAAAPGLTPEQEAYAKLLREKEQQTNLLQEKIARFGQGGAAPPPAAARAGAKPAKAKIAKKKKAGGGSFLSTLQQQAGKAKKVQAASAGKEVSGCDDTVSKKLHNPNQRVTSGRLY